MSDLLIDTHLGTLFASVSGEGVPIVVWPSLLMDGRMWDGQVRQFEDGFQVVRLDPPGTPMRARSQCRRGSPKRPWNRAGTEA